ncbi:MAG: ATP-dependent 6-phosphofructokinase [Candidatus Krumholzibacteriota bacterium]|nr:ATP-dependent 6-phosphofructokinase [Candidatus Krumholzibacteriota bacterium]
MAKRLGILTGGGDVPGLNSCIRAVVERSLDEGYETIGIRRGWGGLLNLRPDDEASRSLCLKTLERQAVRTVSRHGGTFLHTSRVNPASSRRRELPEHLRERYPEGDQEIIDATDVVLENVEKLGLDVLVTIGGDDTLSFSERLDREGVKVVAVPKTMDNDVFGTDYCIGFSTAVTRSVNLINDLRTVAGSHERIMIVELFGRNSGETALITSWLAEVDRTVISEVPFDPIKLADMLARDKYSNPSRYSVLTISEGARIKGGDIVQSGEPDAYGHRKLGGIGQRTAEFIKERTRDHIIYQQLGYLMRSGSPDSLDRMVARNFGNLAVDLLRQGQTGRMVCLREGRYDSVPLRYMVTGTKRVDVQNFYDIDEYRAKTAHVQGMPMFLY